MTRFELTLKIEMPTEMTDLPSIDVYKDGKIIEAHEGIYAEDLYNVIIGRYNFYDEINRLKNRDNTNKNWCLTCQSKEDCEGIDNYSMMTKEQCISGDYCLYCEEE